MFRYYKKLRKNELAWIKKVPSNIEIDDKDAIEISQEEYERLYKKLFTEIEAE